VQRLSSWLDAVPLRARLVAIIALLLAAGLALTSALTQTVVSRYLVNQVDQQILSTTANRTALTETIASAGAGPTDYFVLGRLANGDEAARAWAPTIALHGEPRIPDMSFAAVRAREGAPFTVTSSGGTHPAEWRVTATIAPINIDSSPTQPGLVFVAFPLAQVKEASAVLARTLLAAGVGIVLLGAGAAWWLVRRSLRPLSEIETTAAAIAAGDYTRRVTAAPATTEVGSLSTSLNAMLAQIEQAFAAREESERRMRRFVSDASHELRTPLATIRGYGELYRMGALDTPQKVDDTMVRVEDAARRMGLLVNDLLVLARLDEGRPMRTDRVDLVAMADDAAQDLVALDPTRAVRVVGLTSDAPPSALVVTGDGDRLRQVLTNLVGNVARHTPAGSAAELALGTVADAGDPTRASAVVEVRDHGPGVTPEQARRMFERFYRADSSRTRESGGSGLGLAIVAAIVGAHGGHVTTRTPPDGGLVVRVELPLAGARPASASTTDASTGGFVPAP
jgi:two-component system OmpR family sensor kinase